MKTNAEINRINYPKGVFGKAVKFLFPKAAKCHQELIIRNPLLADLMRGEGQNPDPKTALTTTTSKLGVDLNRLLVQEYS